MSDLQGQRSEVRKAYTTGSAPEERNMNEVVSLGKIIIFIGVAVVIFGAIVLLLARVTGGKGAPLPGDIVIRRDNIAIYFPIVTMLVASIILTLLAWIVAAFRR